MKKIILIALCMMCIIGTASAYQFYLSCPESVQVGIPLKCSIDSNFPAGTTFDVAMYQSGYTATPVKSQTMTIQENNPTQYSILDTKGLPGGQYKVEIDFMGNDEGRLSTDSITLQLPVLIDRSGEITITSPMTQALVDALRIEGYITKLADILALHTIKSITVVHMEVPCCSGVRYVVDQAMEKSGKSIPVKDSTITINGELE